MRTIRTKVMKFNELSNDAKETAIESFRNDNNYDYEDITNDAWDTVQKFADLFNIRIDSIDFLETYRSKYSFSNIEDNILDLSGTRLATYIWNNYKTDLFKGKYYNYKSNTKEQIKHKRIKSIYYKNSGLWGNYYYSAITLEHSCVLTGWCYDDDILQPIYDFLNKPTKYDFRDLLEDCITSICKTVENEIDYRNTDEAIKETIEANEYEFTKDGRIF